MAAEAGRPYLCDMVLCIIGIRCLSAVWLQRKCAEEYPAYSSAQLFERLTFQIPYRPTPCYIDAEHARLAYNC